VGFLEVKSRMNNYWLSLAMLIVSILVYQLSQKMLPTLNVWHLLTIVYLIALVICFVLGLIDRGDKSLWESARQMNWVVLLLAVSILGIELSWIFVIRSGGNISSTGLLANVSVAVLILPLGLFLFREKLSTTNLIGIAICILGLILVAKKDNS
jgi:drug/metabolite transporter (DMT)-like permease